jgi:hypothetical protein
MRTTRFRVAGALFLVIVAALAVSVANGRIGQSHPQASVKPVKAEPELAPRIAKKIAAAAKASPNGATIFDSEGNGAGYDSFAAQDWAMHSQDGGDNGTPPFSAFATARNDWFGLLGRPASGTGKWVPLGPTTGLNDLTNVFRDRTVYTAGTQNFSGRISHAVISPDCTPTACTMYIAATNGGVWRTDNALAVDDSATPAYEGPSWEFVSETFEQQNSSALALDPNDPTHKTIWAGTGEPNACSSGCEVGVGLYESKSGGKGWKGPLGADVFFGRGIGDVQVKPGDSKTIFVASGRATRGISNTCCGGADALIPGAPHFGVYRSKDEGKSWELVNQGAEALCTASTPDVVSLNQTACSARGARYIRFDPVDPNTVYASFFSRGIWRSRSNGDPGTWEQIFAPVGDPLASTSELPAFDVVKLPNGETRMYVGVGGGAVFSGTPPLASGLSARFYRSDSVRSLPAAATQATFVRLSSLAIDTPGYSSQRYCDPQCSYDNYVYAPANNEPNSGASADVVYLSGSNQYDENNAGPDPRGRSNARGVAVSTNGGVSFNDMTEDDTSDTQPGALHPDHHALVVNPANWKQFFDLSDGGVNRSNGVFVDDSSDCSKPNKAYTGTALTFCRMMLAQVPQKLDAINVGLRTLAMYTLDYSRTNPDRLAAGTQDNGSWETLGGPTWLQINIADGGPNRFDATGADPNWALTAFQSGQLEVRYNPMQQYDVNWIADTLTDPTNVPNYAAEQSAFMVPAISDPVVPGHLFTGREHVFRSTNYGRNPVLATKEAHRANCNIWSGAFADLNGNHKYDLPGDSCDDWKALGDPTPAGRLTGPTYGAPGDKSGLYVSATQRAESDSNTLWVATGGGRIFVSKNANDADPAAVTFDRIDNDPTAGPTPPRYPTDIFVDRKDPNHAWITYSGYNAKTPATPGHVFEVYYVPGASKFILRDGSNRNNNYGDIPANSIIQTDRGTVYVGTDYGVVVREPNNDNVWKMAPAGLPNIDTPDLIYIPQRDVLIAATHGQGAWQLKVQ